MYSKNYKSIDELPEHAVIAIPNDSINMENTLLFLQDEGLITLGEKTESFYTILDIAENISKKDFPVGLTVQGKNADSQQVKDELYRSGQRRLTFQLYHNLGSVKYTCDRQTLCSESTAYPYHNEIWSDS